jgi:hypothetical protein
MRLGNVKAFASSEVEAVRRSDVRATDVRNPGSSCVVQVEAAASGIGRKNLNSGCSNRN